MSIFDLDYNTQADLLLPPKKRKPKFKEWLYSIFKPLQWLRDLILNYYKTGTSYLAWNIATAYVKGDRALWIDRGVYEANVANTGIQPTGQATSTVTWTKVIDVYIGVDERITWSGQIIKLESALNRWFMNPQPAPQIFIENTASPNTFLMSNDSAYSNYMPNNSAYAEAFMPNVYDPVSYDFTVWVPIALFNTLGTNTQNRENAVRQFVDLYKVPGTTYNVDTF